ncbi:hypothetical protein ID866_8290 [Astraeus odoratus]|nr:hypothetical protein ID866_8290 [Astraeus odoratus]
MKKVFSRVINGARHDIPVSESGTLSTKHEQGAVTTETSRADKRTPDNVGNTDEQGNSSILPPDPAEGTPIDTAELSDIIAKHGHAPATAWLEKERYRIWRPSGGGSKSRDTADRASSEPSFLPVQGYLHAGDWVFGWGGPIVDAPPDSESRRKVLEDTATEFTAWVQAHDLWPVYCCVDRELEDILGNMGWSTVSCVNEDVMDPEHVLELTSEADKGGHGSMVKDLKKNLRRAERADVTVTKVPREEWTDELRKEVEEGIAAWKAQRKGVQLAAVVGVLILTPAGDSSIIKNCASFPDAPKGTSERLIHSVLQDVHDEHGQGRAPVTFNLSAAGDLEPTRNISGWKFTWLRNTYRNVSKGANLLQRSNFRSKFDASQEPMFVCYPTEDGFGLEGVETLLRMLRR